MSQTPTVSLEGFQEYLNRKRSGLRPDISVDGFNRYRAAKKAAVPPMPPAPDPLDPDYGGSSDIGGSGFLPGGGTSATIGATPAPVAVPSYADPRSLDYGNVPWRSDAINAGPERGFGEEAAQAFAQAAPRGLPDIMRQFGSTDLANAVEERQAVQVGRQREGITGDVARTVGGMAGGLINPQEAPANVIGGLTGAKAVQVAGPVLTRIAGVAGPRVATLVQHAIGGAGGMGPLAGLHRAGEIAPEQWAADPAGSFAEVLKATGIGAATGGVIGTATGSIGGLDPRLESAARLAGDVRGVGRGYLDTPQNPPETSRNILENNNLQIQSPPELGTSRNVPNPDATPGFDAIADAALARINRRRGLPEPQPAPGERVLTPEPPERLALPEGNKTEIRGGGGKQEPGPFDYERPAPVDESGPNVPSLLDLEPSEPHRGDFVPPEAPGTTPEPAARPEDAAADQQRYAQGDRQEVVRGAGHQGQDTAPADATKSFNPEGRLKGSGENGSISGKLKNGEAASKSTTEPRDFTARRLIDEPADGEPRGPVTSARNAMMAEDRRALGLDALDGPERRSWQAALDTAIERKIPENALRTAAEVISKPRALDDVETAGMVHKANSLKNEHRALMDAIGKAKDPADIRLKAAEASRVEAEFDTLSTALRRSGTEQGRSLAARKLTLDQDFSVVAMKSRLKAAAGRELTPAEHARIEHLSKRLEETSGKLAEAEKALAEQRAEQAIKRHPGRRRVPPETREAEFASLLSRAKELLAKGCD